MKQATLAAILTVGTTWWRSRLGFLGRPFMLIICATVTNCAKYLAPDLNRFLSVDNMMNWVPVTHMGDVRWILSPKSTNVDQSVRSTKIYVILLKRKSCHKVAENTNTNSNGMVFKECVEVALKMWKSSS